MMGKGQIHSQATGVHVLHEKMATVMPTCPCVCVKRVKSGMVGERGNVRKTKFTHINMGMYKELILAEGGD